MIDEYALFLVAAIFLKLLFSIKIMSQDPSPRSTVSADYTRDELLRRTDKCLYDWHWNREVSELLRLRTEFCQVYAALKRRTVPSWTLEDTDKPVVAEIHRLALSGTGVNLLSEMQDATPDIVARFTENVDFIYDEICTKHHIRERVLMDLLFELYQHRKRVCISTLTALVVAIYGFLVESRHAIPTLVSAMALFLFNVWLLFGNHWIRSIKCISSWLDRHLGFPDASIRYYRQRSQERRRRTMTR